MRHQAVGVYARRVNEPQLRCEDDRAAWYFLTSDPRQPLMCHGHLGYEIVGR